MRHAALPTASGSQGGSSFGAPRHTNFEKTCATILKKVKEELGKDTVIFDRAVDRALLPDYYRVVTKPMDLGRIGKKLERHEYSAPQDFCEVRRAGRFLLMPPCYAPLTCSACSVFGA